MIEPKKTKILVFGVSGMLGSTIFRSLSDDTNLAVFGTVRGSRAPQQLIPELRNKVIPNIHMESEVSLLNTFSHVKPDIVINCVGIIKQLPNANDHLESLAINSTLPHRLAKYCTMMDARLVHFSTDCVFSGKKGKYKETDTPDAYDVYGRTKLLGEVEYSNAITLRTSIIGHELASSKSLVDWFLSQSGSVKGFAKAIFSGLPTIEVARIVRDLVIPKPDLCGLYHLSVQPINKCDLLKLVAKVYRKDIDILSDRALIIDRSLNSDRFRSATGYVPKPWPELIQAMYDDYRSSGVKYK